ncbi:hypothetical protein BJY52DRAFT_447389 [Lactarius psammicola]|nr:hypothetical protein BJY52DRAFT_447389 [Lactarius psammicola]
MVLPASALTLVSLYRCFPRPDILPHAPCSGIPTTSNAALACRVCAPLSLAPAIHLRLYIPQGRLAYFTASAGGHQNRSCAGSRSSDRCLITLTFNRTRVPCAPMSHPNLVPKLQAAVVACVNSPTSQGNGPGPPTFSKLAPNAVPQGRTRLPMVRRASMRGWVVLYSSVQCYGLHEMDMWVMGVVAA